MTDKERIAALEERVSALEALAKGKAKPGPYTPPEWKDK